MIARDESESVHFAHIRRHIFAWRGPYDTEVVQCDIFAHLISITRICIHYILEYKSII